MSSLKQLASIATICLFCLIILLLLLFFSFSVFFRLNNFYLPSSLPALLQSLICCFAQPMQFLLQFWIFHLIVSIVSVFLLTFCIYSLIMCFFTFFPILIEAFLTSLYTISNTLNSLWSVSFDCLGY